MAYQSTSIQFRSLDDQAEGEFRRWARENYEPDYVKQAHNTFKPDPSVHHPVIIDECAKMDQEWQDQLKARQAKPPYGKEVK